jgi:DNA-binding NtrC family response regulator
LVSLRDSTAEAPEVFVVDDDPAIRGLLNLWLGHAGYRVSGFESALEALRTLRERRPAAICLDVKLPDMDGVSALERLVSSAPEVPVVMITGGGVVSKAVECMRLGALDYLMKPLDRESLLDRVVSAVQIRSAASTGPVDGMVGESPVMNQLFSEVQRVADSAITVYLHGESGTGKELVAGAIHQIGPRASKPFVAINCGAIPESLQDAELFGYEKGAFTGAASARPGRFEQADGGTIFLDEVAELKPEVQVRLLRVLQESVVQRVGGKRPIPVDVRVISATHADLYELVADGRFREDLFFRLVVFPVRVPPLRERAGDVALLAEYFLRKYSSDSSDRVIGFDSEALRFLDRQEWHGNVRQLENLIHASIVHTPGPRITTEVLAELLERCGGAQTATRPKLALVPAQQEEAGSQEVIPLATLERRAIERSIGVCGGNLTDAARRLGIGRATLYRKLAKYGLRTEA